MGAPPSKSGQRWRPVLIGLTVVLALVVATQFVPFEPDVRATGEITAMRGDRFCIVMEAKVFREPGSSGCYLLRPQAATAFPSVGACIDLPAVPSLEREPDQAVRFVRLDRSCMFPPGEKERVTRLLLTATHPSGFDP
jgi:hypothetical protein